MAQVVKGFIGDQPVELNNAATEATLSAMLSLAKKDSAILAAMARKAGVDAEVIKKASKALEQQAAAGTQASQGLGSIMPKANILGGFLMDMGQSVSKTAGNLIQFGDELLEGKARASDLFKAFKDLPLGMGLLAQMFQKVMQYQERNLDIYRQISDTGAGLNGSLNSVRTQAAGMYLTLEEFADVMKTNSDVFRQLGGNAGAGAKAFQGISRSLMQSKLGDELLGLGFSFTQANNLIGSYIRTSGDSVRAGKNVADEHARLAKASAQYGKDLDFLARLTGESRDAAQKKLEEAQMETSWQMFVNSITDPVRKQNIQQALMRAQATGDKGTVDLFKARMMGFASAFSEEGMTVQSMFRGATEMVEGFVRVGKSSMSQEQAQLELDKLQAKGTEMTIKELEQYKNIVMATGQGAEGANKQLMSMQDLANKYNQAGQKNYAQILQGIIDARKRGEADSDAAAAAVTNEKRMKDLSNQINLALLPVMDLLSKYANELVKSFSDFIKNVDMKKLGNDIKEFVEKIVNYTKNLFTEEGRNKILNDIKTLFEEIGIAIRVKLDPTYWQSDAAKDRNRLLLQQRVADAQAKEATLREEFLGKQRRLNDTNTEELAKQITDLQNKRKLIDEDTKLSKDEKIIKTAQLNEEIKNLETRKKSGEALLKDKESLAKLRADVETTGAKYNKARQDTADYVARETAWKAVGYDYTKGIKLAGEGENRWNYATGEKKFYSGTAGTGPLLQNFGKGTKAELHGREAVLNEQQLTNLARGTADTGVAEAQKQLASALLALNKQQERTNVLLGSIADYTRRTSEMGSNKFARV